MFRYDLAMSFCTYIYRESLSGAVEVTQFFVCGKYNGKNTVGYCHDRLQMEENVYSNPNLHQLFSLVLL